MILSVLQPRSAFSNAIVSSFIIIMCLNNFSSSSDKNPLALTFSIFIRSRVIFVVVSNSGGLKGKGFNVNSGSSEMVRQIWQSSGNCAGTGLTFLFTHLYIV